MMLPQPQLAQEQSYSFLDLGSCIAHGRRYRIHLESRIRVADFGFNVFAQAEAGRLNLVAQAGFAPIVELSLTRFARGEAPKDRVNNYDNEHQYGAENREIRERYLIFGRPLGCRHRGCNHGNVRHFCH